MLTLSQIAGLVFRCRHRHLSRPMSLRNPSPSPPASVGAIPAGATSYVVCLDCGARFRYDFDRMAVAEPLAPDPPAL